jgi:hypothetical protein
LGFVFCVSLLIVCVPKVLQKTPSEKKRAEAAIDAADWEEYDVRDPLFPFVALAQEARNLYLPRAVDVLKEPVDALTFYREYVAQNVPVVIRNATKNWKTGQWSNAYLRRAMGAKEVSVECTPKGKVGHSLSYYSSHFVKRGTTFARASL